MNDEGIICKPAPMREEFKLPNGKITTSVTRWAREWRRLSDRVEKAFPSLQLIGCDPNFLFKYGNTSINMPKGFVIELVAKLDRKG